MFNERSEFEKLVSYLKDHDYKYTTTLSIYNGVQVVVYSKETGMRIWDAVCNSISYGHDLGLLEVAGSIVRSSEGVDGWLTAQDIIDRLEENNA